MNAELFNSISNFVGAATFPCVMAKAAFTTGYVVTEKYEGCDVHLIAPKILNDIGIFITEFREKPGRLSSFIVSFNDPSLKKFENFEKFFWQLLGNLESLEPRQNTKDKRVSNDPNSPHFSFSLKGEAFFMLLLHPESPRMARQFEFPSIVFNAHQQFEDLRKKGVFQKIRDLIRKRDIDLQGFINPMVIDYGKSSEVFQYTGRVYEKGSKCPFKQAMTFLKGSS